MIEAKAEYLYFIFLQFSTLSRQLIMTSVYKGVYYKTGEGHP